MTAILLSGLIAGVDDEPHDVTRPRQVPHTTRWKVYQNVVCWINYKNIFKTEDEHFGKHVPILCHP